MGCTVAENERNPDQGDDENALHDIQQHKSVCEIPATGIFLFVCLFVQSISGDLGYITQRFVTSVGNSTFV